MSRHRRTLGARLAAAVWRVHGLMPGRRRQLRTARWWLLWSWLYVALLVVVVPATVTNPHVLVLSTAVPMLGIAWCTHVAYQRDAVLNMAVSTAVASVRALRPDLGDGTVTVASDHGVISRHVPRNPPA